MLPNTVMESYLVIIQKAGSNYCAYSPDVLGCISTGDTVEQTRRTMKEALESHLELMAEDGDELPHAKGLLHYLSGGEEIAEPDDLITHITIRLPAVA